MPAPWASPHAPPVGCTCTMSSFPSPFTSPTINGSSALFGVFVSTAALNVPSPLPSSTEIEYVDVCPTWLYTSFATSFLPSPLKSPITGSVLSSSVPPIRVRAADVKLTVGMLLASPTAWFEKRPLRGGVADALLFAAEAAAGASVPGWPGRVARPSFLECCPLRSACFRWNWLDRLGCALDPKPGSEPRNSVIKTTYFFIRFSFSKSEMCGWLLLNICPPRAHSRCDGDLLIIGQT